MPTQREWAEGPQVLFGRRQSCISDVAVGTTQGTPVRMGVGSCHEVACTMGTCRYSLAGQRQSTAFSSPRAILKSRRL